MSKKTSLSESELVARMNDGESGAWREFLRRYGRLIRYVGRRLRLEAEEVDDLFQGVSLQIHRKLGTLEDPERLASWTYSVALNEGRQMLRRRRPMNSIDDDAVLRQVERERDPDLSEEELREALGATEGVRTALLGIDDRCRRLLLALYFRDPRPAYTEISGEFGIAVGSIGPIRGRCLERLARRLANVSDGTPPASSTRDGDSRNPGQTSPRGTSAVAPHSARSSSRRNR